MSSYSKEYLESLKVAELKELATALSLESKGLRKAELVEVIFEFTNNQEPEVKEVPEEPEDLLDAPEIAEVEVPQSTAVEPELEEDAHELSVTENLPKYITKSAAVLYSTPEKQKFICRVQGTLKVLGCVGDFYFVETVIDGRGKVSGYIAK